MLNGRDRIMVREIIEELSIDLATLRKALKSAICKPSTGVVQNTSGKPAFTDLGEEIFANMNFTSQTIKRCFLPKAEKSFKSSQ